MSKTLYSTLSFTDSDLSTLFFTDSDLSTLFFTDSDLLIGFEYAGQPTCEWIESTDGPW
jgi:hypothetical protein